MEITLKEHDGRGFAMAREDGKRAGEMTFTVPSPDLIIIDHTEVGEEYGGRGVGKKLLYKIVEMAREKNIKILPLCPFAKSMFGKIPEIQDVLRP